MKLGLISPRIALQKGDFLGSGVPYWPIELATLAAFARLNGDNIFLIDQFGADPSFLTDEGDYYLQGIPINSLIWRSHLNKADCFILYALSYMSHRELLTTVKWLKQEYPKKRIVILENSQAVTAYSLNHMANEFFDVGADVLICGEPYFNWDEIKQSFISNDSNARNIITPISSNQPQRITQKVTRYPVPAWDLINLSNYWKLPYSHGPKTKKFLPILTSRGCPYPCDFCVIPETNDKRWRGNSPEDVVTEILELKNKYDVCDFQIEDLNPTVQHQRWEIICELLIKKNAGIRFYFVSGTKAETLHIDKIPLFYAAGCRYISISPESGSTTLMKRIGKRFNKVHASNLILACRKYRIRTQACFLVGHPSETEIDFQLTQNYLVELIKAGLDEVAIFIVAPFAGSVLYEKNSIALNNKKFLPSFSPRGRKDYKLFESRRNKLIAIFFFEKFKKGFDLWLQGIRSIFGTPQTKMENIPKRIFYIKWIIFKNKLYQQ